MGNCWSKTKSFSASLFGREERHNPEGKGPSGRVFDKPERGNINRDGGDHQIENRNRNPNGGRICS